MKPKRTAHQERGVKYALAHPYCILALDPRLGKTRIAIEAHEESKRKTCLVICPGYLIDHWSAEIKKWISKRRIITKIRKGAQIYDLIDTDYAIISYDLSLKAEYFFEWAETVVVDEPHLYLKTMEAKRTQFIHKQIFENSIASVWQLTGTPIKNRVAEFYCPLALCFYNPKIADPEFLERFPTSIDFADYFSNRHEFKIEVNNRWIPIVKWTGMRHVKELKGYLKGRYLRIKATEADLPPIVYKDFLVSETPDPQLLKAFKSFFEIGGKDSVAPDIKAEAALKKVPITIQYVKDMIEDKIPVIIYSDHRAPVKEFGKYFNIPAITGEMPGKRRLEIAREFQAGKHQAIAATIGSFTVGVDCSRANDLIVNDLPWVPGDLKQMVNRIRMVGQKQKKIVHRVFGSPQDEKISHSLFEKQEVIDKVT